MTSRYVLSPAASRDLDRIWDFTAERWGRTQANKYITQIRSTAQRLATGKVRARPADDLKPGYSKYPVGSHVLFLRAHESAAFEVVRVLHQSMDAGAQLDKL